MTVNKGGRPSKARERRAEILIAAASVVAREGFDGVTMAKVADEIGVHRTLVCHYFGDRQALVDTFLDEVVSLYGDQQLLGDPATPIEERIRAAFGPTHYGSRDELVIWTELVALGARDERVRAQLSSLWRERWLPKARQALRDARPTAPRAQVDAVAYGIICLVEAHWSLHIQGVDDPTSRRHARTSAQLLLATLDG